jgi:large conductance mechanosensitive channel
MTGFKNFLLRGSLVELAVAFIMGSAFATVVAAFVAWLTSLLPKAASDAFDNETPSGAFGNALIAFILLAAVVYFLVVVPYTKAKERYFPSEEPGEPADVALLGEIRDLLAEGRPANGAPGSSGTI